MRWFHRCCREVLVITGDHDTIIPPEHLARMRSLLPPHSHYRVPAEHNLLLTHPDAVVEALLTPPLVAAADISAPCR